MDTTASGPHSYASPSGKSFLMPTFSHFRHYTLSTSLRSCLSVGMQLEKRKSCKPKVFNFVRHLITTLTLNVESKRRSFHFLSRVSILTRDIDIANMSVCLSVRPSICRTDGRTDSTVRNVPVSDENGLTYCHSFFHLTVAQSFWFYRHQTSSKNSDGVTPLRGR